MWTNRHVFNKMTLVITFRKRKGVLFMGDIGSKLKRLRIARNKTKSFLKGRYKPPETLIQQYQITKIQKEVNSNGNYRNKVKGAI